MEKFLYNIIVRLRTRHKIILLTPSFNNISIPGVNIKLIPVPKTSIPFIKTIFGIFYIWIILPYFLKKKKIEIVSIFNLSFIGANVLLISKFLNIPNYINLRGVFERKSLIKFLEYEFCLFFTNNLIINSKDMMERFLKITHLPKNYYLSKKFYYIPNGINFKYWEQKSLKFKNIDKKYDLVFVGNMTHPRRWIQKGFAYLNNALKLIEKKHNLRLIVLVIGEVNFRGTKKIIGKLYKKYFNFVGKISNKIELMKLMLSAKLFVVSSTSEGMPNSLMEAMALGMACVSTRVGAVVDLISDNQEGLLIEPNNVKDLAEKIYELLNNPSLQSELGKNAQIKLKKNFSWKIVIDRIEDCLTKISFN